jgi:hypothetical protein
VFDFINFKKAVFLSAVFILILCCTAIWTGAYTAQCADTSAHLPAAQKNEPSRRIKPPKPCISKDEQEIRALVEAFGKAMQNVSLLSSDASAAMEKYYGEYVTPELLAKWKVNPSAAPGRVASSPWPDRIEVLNIKNIDKQQYLVDGVIIEVTSTELENGGAAAKRPIALLVKRDDGKWCISDVALGKYAAK